MSRFSLHVDMMFARRGVSASYVPAGGSPGDCLIIWKTGDVELDVVGIGAYGQAIVADVRVSEVPVADEGDQLIVSGVTYRVESASKRDSERLVWTMELSE